MVRENRIKDYTFPAVAVTGSNFITYSDNPINGEILKIDVKGIASPGSIWIGVSGTDEIIWKKNDFTSGLSEFQTYPFTYLTTNANATGSPSAVGNMVVNKSIYTVGSAMTSGTGVNFGPIEVYYR